MYPARLSAHTAGDARSLSRSWLPIGSLWFLDACPLRSGTAYSIQMEVKVKALNKQHWLTAQIKGLRQFLDVLAISTAGESPENDS